MIANRPPVAEAGGPYSIDLGDPVAVHAGGSTDPDGRIVSYRWTWYDLSPDTISTDLHQASILSSKSDMPNCISKMMLLGMPLKEAIYRSTQRPAEVIKKYPEIGTLGEGKVADIAVFELETGVFAFADAWRKKMMGNQRLQAVLTVRNGEVVFDRDGLGYPEWRKAGQYDVIE